MAGFSYGASAHLRSGDSFSFEDDVLQRSADDDLDDMVQQNIRDVLQRVNSDDAAGPLGHGGDQQPLLPGDHYRIGAQALVADEGSAQRTDMCGAEPAASAADGPSIHNVRQQPLQQRPADRRKPSNTQQQQPTASQAAHGSRRSSHDPVKGGPAATSASGAGLASSTSLLDIPGQPDASLRLHKARIKALEEELGRANRALLDREKQLGDALRELKELRGQAASWAKDKKALEGQLDRAKRQVADTAAAARETESQARELAKADSRAERERRATEAEVRARDVRLQRALEEVERYKQLLSEVRVQERDAKGSAQQDTSRLVAENRKLERQRTELVVAFKKQLKLIEVLKRQKVHLEAARALQFSEEEFLKTIEMGAA